MQPFKFVRQTNLLGIVTYYFQLTKPVHVDVGDDE